MPASPLHEAPPLSSLLDRFRLDGRLALVTGSSRGIGLGIAQGLASAGARIVVNGRDPDRLEDALGRLRAAGAWAEPAAFDVADPGQAEAAIARIEAIHGPIGILVNNAGLQRRGRLEDFPPDAWAEVLRTNLDSVFLVGQAVARRMLPRGNGKIINIASVLSEVARPTVAPYATSKGAVKMLTRAMAVEWAPHGLQVNAIGPGFIATDMTEALSADPGFDAWLRARTPAGRWGRLEDLQGAAVFLASPASDFVNGQILHVDGGLLAAL